jgi:hypothetical protein
MPSIYERAKR